MSFIYPPTIIVRHNRENLKKCSLSGLEPRQDCRFYLYPHCVKEGLGDLSNYCLLDFEGEPLSRADAHRGLVLLDGTWRYAAKMKAHIPGIGLLPKRSLPLDLKTAYPRRQEDCQDPERGLASVEALFAAYVLMGRDAYGLLDAYYWKDSFILKNKQLFDFK